MIVCLRTVRVPAVDYRPITPYDVTGGFLNILPPGQGQTLDATEAAAALAPCGMPPEFYDDQREMYGLYLRARGFHLLAATNGMEAMALARQVRPDVIVMDLAMPNLNGWEATQRLKHDPLTQSIPVIACTAHTGEWAVDRAVKAGCDAYLTKPCLPRDLVAEIRRVMTLPAPDDRPAEPRMAGSSSRSAETKNRATS